MSCRCLLPGGMFADRCLLPLNYSCCRRRISFSCAMRKRRRTTISSMVRSASSSSSRPFWGGVGDLSSSASYPLSSRKNHYVYRFRSIGYSRKLIKSLPFISISYQTFAWAFFSANSDEFNRNKRCSRYLSRELCTPWRRSLNWALLRTFPPNESSQVCA